MSSPKTLVVRDICKAHEAIVALIKDDRENKFVFPSAVRIKLAGNLRKTKPAYEDFTQVKIDLFKKYGDVVKDAEGKDTDKIQLRASDADKANKELAEALEVDTHQTLNPITVKDLGENQIDVELIAVLQDVGLLTE